MSSSINGSAVDLSNFTEISPKELPNNPFRLIGDDWMLITAGNKTKYNTMTASWGGVGIMWNKPAATIYVRPQRYTFEFIEASDYFTLSFFTDEYKPALGICGKKSGREIDKAAECNLNAVSVGESIAFQEAKLILLCKKVYHNDIDPANFHDGSIDSANYPNKDYHRMYIGEIVNVYQKRD